MEVDRTREYIKRYVKTALLEANTLAGERVFLNRPINYQFLGKEFAEIRILSLNSVAKIRDHAPRVYTKNFTLGIELAYVPKIEDYDEGEDNFELLISQIEAVILHIDNFSDPAIIEKASLPGDFQVQDVFLGGIEYRTETEGERPVYIALINHDVIYNQAVGPGREDLEDLESAHIRQVAEEDDPSVDSELSFSFR